MEERGLVEDQGETQAFLHPCEEKEKDPQVLQAMDKFMAKYDGTDPQEVRQGLLEARLSLSDAVPEGLNEPLHRRHISSPNMVDDAP